MDSAVMIKDARRRAGMSQTALAQRAGTSQATISLYESGAKQPSLATLERLLAVTGHRLEVHGQGVARLPSRSEIARRGRILAQVLGLAEALPARRRGKLSYPRLSPLPLGGPRSHPS